MQTLTINGIESKMTKTGNTKVVLVCQEGKFYFYRTTKTGISKAQEQFNKYMFKIGDVVEAEVKTEDKTFTNAKGDEITYKDNWIKFFAEVEGTPVVKTLQNTPQSSQSHVTVVSDINVPSEELKTLQAKIDLLNIRFDKMVEWAKNVAMKEDIETFKTLLVDLKGEPAVELHGSISDKTEFNLEEAKEILQDPKNKGL